jgi:hypothetical protein
MSVVRHRFNGTLRDLKVKPGDPQTTVEVKLEIPLQQMVKVGSNHETRPLEMTDLAALVGKDVMVELAGWQPELPLFAATGREPKA